MKSVYVLAVKYEILGVWFACLFNKEFYLKILAQIPFLLFLIFQLIDH